MSSRHTDSTIIIIYNIKVFYTSLNHKDLLKIMKVKVANSKCDIERHDEINDNINNFVSIVGKREE